MGIRSSIDDFSEETVIADIERNPARLFAPPSLRLSRQVDGSRLLRSPMTLQMYARCVSEWLVYWAEAVPQRPYLFERDAVGAWQGISYAAALQQVLSIASWLLQNRLSVDRPLAILSDNGVEHGLLALAAMHVGIPVVPVSSAYSLMSNDFSKLKAIFSVIQPGAVFVVDRKRYGPALAAVSAMHDGRVIVGRASEAASATTSFNELLRDTDTTAVNRAFAAVNPDTIAKILFTSGSTGAPKGVINTQRMLCSNQQAMAQIWPFLDTTPPVVVDWLPWNHTFGGNHNFNMILRNGGTLYVDAGRPAPGLFDQTVRNLREVAPTIYFNVPRGFDMLVSALREDETLRCNFFSRLQLIFYAAAALPQNLWESLTELAEQTVGMQVPLVSSWGSTETAPAATSCHYQAEQAGVIGLPVPGTELKLVHNGNKLEVRVRGANVTPGYWKLPEATAAAFDSDGFYSIGDAVKLLDERRPELGLLFDGRVSEDFKLSTGTWVNTGALRIKAIAVLAPIAQDVVLTGHDRDHVGFLIFPNIPGCRRLCHELAADAPIARVLANESLRANLRAGLEVLRREGTGSSTYAAVALLMSEPPSIDSGEITDKGYINQRAVLARRADLVHLMHEVPSAPEPIRLL
jgi:feruloyl-CoA synthase